MTTKKTTKTDPATEAAVKGKFAQIVADAEDDDEPVEPYIIDDVYPAIIITEPIEYERVLPLAKLYSEKADKYGRMRKDLDPKDFEPLLRALCGDAYDRVVDELLVGRHFRVARAFINDVQAHFAPKAKPLTDDDAEALAG